jgi:hypothetical protein
MSALDRVVQMTSAAPAPAKSHPQEMLEVTFAGEGGPELTVLYTADEAEAEGLDMIESARKMRAGLEVGECRSWVRAR